MVKKRGKKQIAKKAVKAKQSAITESKNSEVTAGLVPAFQPVFIKVCRLCETKDGPFLNIFETDKLTAKRIDAVMPFKITENDDLPHKICFRCSAKLEELYEFIQKCIKTQDRLQKALGRKLPCTKVKHREMWEEKLNQSNISNDDICDALIKKAMEGIKDIPLNSKPLQELESSFIQKNTTKLPTGSNNVKNNGDSQRSTAGTSNTFGNYKTFLGLDNIKKEDTASIQVTQEHSDHEAPIIQSLRSSNDSKTNESEKNVKPKEANKIDKKGKNARNMEVEDQQNKGKEVPQTNTFSLNDTTPKPEPTFNIMEHVSMIKVNGVGVLFQCKLCNRNFLKKQVVMAHACAKNGSAKVLGPKPIIAPEQPKISTVKYINTKTVETKKAEEENKTADKPLELDSDKPVVIKKLKPRIGPASKVRRFNDDTSSNITSAPVEAPHTDPSSQTETGLVVQVPKYPSLNSHYKLMAGPNNTFTLVEEKVGLSQEAQPVREKQKITILQPKDISKSITENRPYPVKLFKTSAHNSDSEPSFTTPAMKKQSYTVVQTDNPSKLLISSKPQPEEIPKKKLRRNRNDDKMDEPKEQPFSVTLEDITPAKDDGFFTFVNVDPLLQPSYVLPTDNIIQESQISTSTNIAKQNIINDSDFKYSCNLCNEVFSREKKLLTHINSHYNKIDEEDKIRAEKPGRKRKK